MNIAIKKDEILEILSKDIEIKNKKLTSKELYNLTSKLELLYKSGCETGNSIWILKKSSKNAKKVA